MKLSSKIAAGLLVMLGFAGCKPGEIEEPCMYGPPSADMYGPPTAVFERKHVPGEDGTVIATTETVMRKNDDESA